ncbi:hypothetical protein BC332_18680 [Capsicum chinense]|nr:hypothetical protein BC332_18680 [Capsicum chinense]
MWSIMVVAEEIIVGGNYMSMWEEVPKYWKWKSSSTASQWYKSIGKDIMRAYNRAHHRERHVYVLKCKDYKLFPAAEKILRDNMSKGDSFYVKNISGDETPVFGSGCTTEVDLLERSCTCRKFELVKIPCAHAMSTLRVKYSDDYGFRVYDYSLPMYKVEEYLLTYSESINAVPLESK